MHTRRVVTVTTSILNRLYENSVAYSSHARDPHLMAIIAQSAVYPFVQTESTNDSGGTVMLLLLGIAVSYAT